MAEGVGRRVEGEIRKQVVELPGIVEEEGWRRGETSSYRVEGAEGAHAKVMGRISTGLRCGASLASSSAVQFRTITAQREIDVDDLPPPPPRAKTALGIENEQAAVPTPYEAKAFFAPRPTNEILRQNVLNRIDVFGKYRKKESPALVQEPAPPAVPPKQVVDYEPGNIKEEDVCVPTPPGEFGPSLKAHPAFKRIVAFARQTFGTKFSLLSVLDNDQQSVCSRSNCWLVLRRRTESSSPSLGWAAWKAFLATSVRLLV